MSQPRRTGNDIHGRAWVEVNLDALTANYRHLRQRLPDKVRIMAVLKADAYGCGDLAAARQWEAYPEDWYAVANLEEALRIRQGGSRKPILILGYTPPEEAPVLIGNRITQTVVSPGHGLLLAKAAQGHGRLNVHLKLDTGMSRLGLRVYGGDEEEAFNQAQGLFLQRNLAISGIYTHLSCLYELDEESRCFSEAQYSRFMIFTKALQDAGYDVGLRHCLNSAGVVNMPQMALDMVRPGTILYGALPDACKSRELFFDEALTVKAAVALVRSLKPGMYVNYSKDYRADRPMDIAVLSIGYSDFLRIGSGPGNVLISGVPCPVVGGVCMDQLTVDISRAGKVKAGDIAVILGRQQKARISLEDMAGFLNSAANEVYCHLTGRLPRIYYQGGKPIPGRQPGIQSPKVQETKPAESAEWRK